MQDVSRETMRGSGLKEVSLRVQRRSARVIVSRGTVRNGGGATLAANGACSNQVRIHRGKTWTELEVLASHAITVKDRNVV